MIRQSKTTTLILLSIILIAGCTPDPNNEKGIEVYKVKTEYPDLSQENLPECLYCLDLTEEDLFDSPILTESDIETFDWDKQQISLTNSGRAKIAALDIPLQGLPVAMVLNGEIIYGFWFWNMASSFGCDRVYTYPTFDFKIKFGLPGTNTYGEDPRFDERLKNHLENKKRETRFL